MGKEGWEPPLTYTQQTDRQTNRSEFVISFSEVITHTEDGVADDEDRPKSFLTRSVFLVAHHCEANTGTTLNGTRTHARRILSSETKTISCSTTRTHQDMR